MSTELFDNSESSHALVSYSHSHHSDRRTPKAYGNHHALKDIGVFVKNPWRKSNENCYFFKASC